MRVVAILQFLGGDGARATSAFGDVFASHFDVDAARPATQAVAEAAPAAPKDAPTALPAPANSAGEPPKKPGGKPTLRRVK